LLNSFWQKEKRIKRYSTLLFSVKEQGLKNRKLRKLFGKGRRRKMSSKSLKISQKLFKKLFKSCKSYWNASQGLAFIDSSCLVKKTIIRVITLRKSWENHWKSYISWLFIQNLSLVNDYHNHVIDYTKHFMKRCDSSQLNLNFNVQIHWQSITNIL